MTGEKEGFLEQLQELGVVDISRSVKPVDQDSSEMFARATRARKAVETLENIDYTKDADFEAISKATVTVDDDPVKFVEDSMTKLGELKISYGDAEKQMKSRLPWGDFDMKAIEGLRDMGYIVRYYITDKKRFDENWCADHALQIVSEADGKIWFVTVARKDEEYSFPIPETAGPEGTYAEALENAEKISKEIVLCKAGLLNAKDYIPAIKESCNSELVNLDRYLAEAAGESMAEDHIVVFTGFAPEENEAELTAKFDEMGVFYLKEQAVEEDNPPIKLKNGWFARQFESFTGMYGMPVYSEFDPTAILAPFYLLFFAMCLGDAGYGIVLFLFGLMLNKGWVKFAMFDGLGTIISILGAGTMVVGTVLGTFFGMSLYEAAWVPQWLKSCMIVGDVEVPGMGMFNIQMLLALAIGVFHICLAMTVKAIGYTKRFGFRENLSTWGWLLLIVGGLITAILAAGKLISPEATKWVVIVIGTLSALGIYIFNTPGRNPLMNIGAGLWDTYNMATGILGDVLSYIRLFALGLAGGMLGQAFNNLAGMVKGDSIITWIPFVLILLFGHVLNILMSSLGAFVHPLRLTFVEYFKNAGYEGKGEKYNPLTTEKSE